MGGGAFDEAIGRGVIVIVNKLVKDKLSVLAIEVTIKHLPLTEPGLANSSSHDSSYDGPGVVS